MLFVLQKQRFDTTIGDRNAGQARDGGVDFIEGAHPDIRYRFGVCRRGGRRRIRVDMWIGFAGQILEGEEKLIAVSALFQRNHRAMR